MTTPHAAPTGIHAGIHFAGQSDAGQVRELNQDTFYVGATPNGALALVADGMGGHQSGEIASCKARDILVQALAKSPTQLPTAVAKAVQRANLAIFDYASAHPESHGMGTTLTFVVLDAQVALIGHVGDSRAYLIRGGQITQLTRDHSWVADRMRQGLLSAEEAKRHGWRNLITNALGTAPEVTLELAHLRVQDGDRLLVCSDGLSTSLPDELLLETVQAASPGGAEGAVAELIGKANARGGPDNVTAALLIVGAVEAKPRRYTLPDETPLSVSLDEGPAGIRTVEDAYMPRRALAKLRRHPLYPLRFWLFGCVGLALAFLFFGLRG